MERLLTNFAMLIGELTVRLLAGLVVMTLVAKSLGPAGFGAFSWVLGLATLLLPLARFATDAVLQRRISAMPDNTGAIMANGLLVAIPASLVAAVAGAVFLMLSDGPAGATNVAVGLALLMVLISPLDGFTTAVKARERMGWLVAGRIAATLLMAGGMAWAAMMSAPLWVFIMIRTAETAVLGILGLAVFCLMGFARGWRASEIGKAHAFAAEGFPLMIAVFCMAGVMRVDQLMMGWLVDEVQLGHYGLAARLAELAWFAPVALQAALGPGIVRNYADPSVSFELFMQRIFDSFSLLAWPVMLGTVACVAILLVPIFGSSYAPAMPMVLALSATTPLYFLYCAFGFMLTVRGLVWHSACVALIAALVNILLNAALIPSWGWAGAALATFAAFVIATFAGAFASTRTRPAGKAMLRALNPAGAAIRLWHIYAPARHQADRTAV